MTELLTAAQMRMIEQSAIETGEVTGLELMERAGRGVVEAIFEEWPDYRSSPQSAAIFCGPGNNGGDGFVVARLLRELDWGVRVWFYGDVDKLPLDARANYDAWAALGDVRPLNEAAFRRDPKAAIYIDAIFGTGLSRPPSGELAEFLGYLGGNGGGGAYFQPRLVAIDAPSGLCLDSGRQLGGGRPYALESSVPLCRLTVAFDSPKAGHFLADGPLSCGKLSIVDIGLAKWRETISDPELQTPVVRRPSLGLVCRDLLVADNRPSRSQVTFPQKHDGHKFSHGHAFILSGGPAQTGAARLAARAALRIGAGVVTLGVPPSAQMECAMQLTAVMLKRVTDSGALAEILLDKRINALCLGPAMGLSDRTREMIAVALKSEASVVLDADALSVFTDDPEQLFEQTRENGKVVLTPHGGEFARLFPDIARKLGEKPLNGPAYSKVDATRDAAKRAGCVVLYKGADTVIADQNGRAAINSAHYGRAAPWLATAGSGDVLAGLITGLLARGFSPLTAAGTAAWLHVACARSFGPGLIAEDIPEELPKVLRALGV